MTNKIWGRFTVKGSEEVELYITSIVKEIGDRIKSNIGKEDYKALVMLGGYGRGEGGVVANGKEKPHNNFDLILITNNLEPRKQIVLKNKLDAILSPIKDKIGIGIDISLINAKKLKNSSCRLMWYDMRFGHKVIFGDTEFVSSLTHFTVENIPDWDARNLLVNRGTLMIINDLLLEKTKLSLKYKKLMVKHIVKAIIGYGDTLLYFLNDYNWSYVEKQKRMKKRKDINKEFQKIYDDAMNFRFQPNYDLYIKKDLSEWMLKLKKHFCNIHLICESKRLNKQHLTWSQYPDMAFKHSITEDIDSFRTIAKKIISFIRSKKYAGDGSFLAKLGFRTLGTSGVLPILFPFIAYNLKSIYYKKIVKNFLNCTSDNFNELRKSYLKKWSKYGDVNFSNVLDKYDISLK